MGMPPSLRLFCAAWYGGFERGLVEGSSGICSVMVPLQSFECAGSDAAVRRLRFASRHVPQTLRRQP